MKKTFLRIKYIVILILVINNSYAQGNSYNIDDIFLSNGWGKPFKGTLESLTCYDYNSDCYPYSFRHGAIDIFSSRKIDEKVYAIADGEVMNTFRRTEKEENMSIIYVKHKTSTGKEFLVLYGHVYPKDGLNQGDLITYGEYIGNVKKYNTPHIHFGISNNASDDSSDTGYKAKQWGGIKGGITDPVAFLKKNKPSSGGLSVKDFWHKVDPIYTNSSFDAQFKLQNNSQSGVTVKDVAMSIHDSNNNFLFNMFLKKSKVDIPAGSYYQVPKTYKNAPSTAGTYKVVAKIQEDNGNWKELKSDPFVVRAKSDSGSNNNDKSSQYIDKCISALSQYCGSKVGEKYSCKENSLCQETTGGQLANVTNIAIDKNITGNEFYYYWDTYGGWSKNGLTLSYCGITATTTDNSANKADGFENRWKSSVKLTVDGNNSWKIIDKSDGYFNICQSSDTNKCLHNEYGSLQLSDIESGWFSAQWYFEDAGNGYIRIHNKWKQSEYIHIEYGSPAVGGIESDWLSAQWKRFKF